MSAESPKSPLNPQAMPLVDAARVFTAASGGSIEVAMLEADVADGAPLNADGTLNLVHYAAWLVRETARGR
jgi:hypothetical protein